MRGLILILIFVDDFRRTSFYYVLTVIYLFKNEFYFYIFINICSKIYTTLKSLSDFSSIYNMRVKLQ